MLDEPGFEFRVQERGYGSKACQSSHVITTNLVLFFTISLAAVVAHQIPESACIISGVSFMALRHLDYHLISEGEVHHTTCPGDLSNVWEHIPDLSACVDMACGGARRCSHTINTM